MSFSIEPKTLKKLIDFYTPNNKGEQMKFMLLLKGEEQMYMNLETSPFQGISFNSIEERIAWFGQNKVNNPFKFPFSKVLIKSLTQYTCMIWTFAFAFILFVVGLFSQYNNLRISYIEGLIGIGLYLLNTTLIVIVEYGKYEDLNKIYEFKSQKNYCDVWRQNKMQEVDAQFIVVGDVIELGAGATIPADDWMIQGQLKVEEQYSYGTIQANKSTMKGCISQIDRMLKGRTKNNTMLSKVKPENTKVQYSPVVLGGSTVIQGQGRIMVFCVGKYSRKGEFELLMKNFDPEKRQSRLQKKMQDHTNQLFKYGFLAMIILVFGLVIKEIVENIISPTKKFSNLLNVSQFDYITLSLNLLLGLVPQGCLLGLSVGLTIHKKRMEYSYQIVVKKLVNCESLCYVQHICHDKETQKSYFRIRQWWNNSGKVQIAEDQPNGQQQNTILKQSEQEERLFKNIRKVNENYLKFFRKTMNITSGVMDIRNERSQKSLQYGSFRNLDECFLLYSRRKSYINLEQIKKDEIIEQIPYDNIRKRTAIVAQCPSDFDFGLPSSSKMSNLAVPKESKRSRTSLRVENSQILFPDYGSQNQQDKKVIIYVRGKHQTVLQLCTYIMCKETGKVVEITEQKALQIKANIDSMLRRQLRAVVLAYKITVRKENIVQSSQAEDESGYVLLAILGINDTRSTQDFQLLTKMKQLGINLMISSSNSMEASVSAANQIGVIKADQSSILINGSDFLHLVGGIVCIICKKPVCACQHGNQNHKIKNIDEFERILKHLDVLANAEAFHKYALVVGLKNKNICTAITGKKLIDIPSMLESQVSLFPYNSQSQSSIKNLTDLQKNALSIQIPNNSVVTLFNLIKESRICNRFIRKFMRLMTCSCVVYVIFSVTNLVLFKEDFGIKLIHIFWVQTVIMMLLALAMAFDYETEDNQSFPIMNEDVKNYIKDDSLIDTDGWKQITIFSLTQLILLFIATFLGPLFIPQKTDNFDSIIGDDFMAKYADSTRTTICSGLPFPFQGSNWQYEQTFDKYGVFSRHQTFLFAFFSTLQIFSYFNFRQFSMKEVNIFKNFKLVSIVIILIALFVNILVVQQIGEYMGLYVNGLTFEQWVICLGISMIEWIVGILARLVPEVRKEENEYKIRWQNKAYNLAVKSVTPQGELSEFEVDQYFQLRPEIFSSRKID